MKASLCRTIAVTTQQSFITSWSSLTSIIYRYWYDYAVKSLLVVCCCWIVRNPGVHRALLRHIAPPSDGNTAQTDAVFSNMNFCLTKTANTNIYVLISSMSSLLFCLEPWPLQPFKRPLAACRRSSTSVVPKPWAVDPPRFMGCLVLVRTEEIISFLFY